MTGDWIYNYFNYFTEIEEHFQKARGTGGFRLSPLDWALIDTWKNSEVPLEAVLRGIDLAFDKWRARKSKTQKVNSLTFCAQAVLTEAQMMSAPRQPSSGQRSAPPFAMDELRNYLVRNAQALRKTMNPPYEEMAEALDRLASEMERYYGDLEQLEQRLTVLEEKMVAVARSIQTEDQLFAVRRELDLQLRPYRSRMTAPQLAMLEKQFLERRLLEAAGLPRLSLFYMR